MRVCPQHKVDLIYDKRSKFKLICSKNGCPHTEYTTEINPILTEREQVYNYTPSWR